MEVSYSMWDLLPYLHEDVSGSQLYFGNFMSPLGTVLFKCCEFAEITGGTESSYSSVQFSNSRLSNPILNLHTGIKYSIGLLLE
jgi:hypothetical protein